MKKIISFFVAVLLVASMLTVGAFADETVASSKVYGTTENAQPGETVTISFMISNNTGFDSAKMSVSAAAPLTVGEITRGLMSGGDVYNNVINHASAAPVTANGTLFTVSIKVAEDAKPGTYPVVLSVTRLNVNGESLNYTYGNGAVVIEAPACDHDYKLTDSKKATCTEAGYETYTCSKCGDSYTNPLAALGHKAGAAEKENVVPATCTAEGSYDSVVYCSVCDAELSRETITTPKAAHNYAVSIKDDVYHTFTCKVCGEAYDELHDKQEDDYHFWCDICGWEKDKTTDPTSPDPSEPVLGDIETVSEFNFGLVALIAVACAAAFVFKRKIVK